MQAAKDALPDGTGQQAVILKVIEYDPSVDSLANSNRWRNAWFGKVSDPDLTELVERAAQFFKEEAAKKRSRLQRQNLKRVSK